jgi:hypothetical protein
VESFTLFVDHHPGHIRRLVPVRGSMGTQRNIEQFDLRAVMLPDLWETFHVGSNKYILAGIFIS